MGANRVALVTGGNKGIGREIARQLAKRGITVVIGSRDEARGADAAASLREEGADAHHVRLDVTKPGDVSALPGAIRERFGRLDILVNNAGIAHDMGIPPSQSSPDLIRGVFETNVVGPIAVAQALLPLLKESPAGRIVNLSSGLGSLARMSDPADPFYGLNLLPYNMSKTALNAFTVALAKELKETKIKVNSADPDWVRTDMGGPDATHSVEEGADTPVWLSTLPDDGPTGGFFHERKPVPW